MKEKKLKIDLNWRQYDIDENVKFEFDSESAPVLIHGSEGDIGARICGKIEEVLKGESEGFSAEIHMDEKTYNHFKIHQKQLAVYPAGIVLEREGNVIKKFRVTSFSLGLKRDRFDFAKASAFPPGENKHTCGKDVIYSKPMTRHEFYKAVNLSTERVKDEEGQCVQVSGGLFWFDKSVYAQLFKEDEEKPVVKKAKKEMPDCPTCGNNIHTSEWYKEGVFICGWCRESFFA